MNYPHLKSIRLAELERVLCEIERVHNTRGKVLEIGAGSGWQAQKIAENGYSIDAIDIEKSNYSEQRVWPVITYDGEHIPFPDNHFDVIFSSNVLEHIPHVAAFQKEIRRVVTPNGIVVHVVPSGSWRFWTNLAHYPFVIRTFLRNVFQKKPSAKAKSNNVEKKDNTTSSKVKIIKKTIIPSRHGAVGSALSELYYFSRLRWSKLFTTTGWKIEKKCTNRLFYTGYMITGFVLSVRIRKLLSFILGSSCHIYLLRNENRSAL